MRIIDINIPKTSGSQLYNEIKKIDDKVSECFLAGSETLNVLSRRLLLVKSK
jgi:hypothetical protein